MISFTVADDGAPFLSSLSLSPNLCNYVRLVLLLLMYKTTNVTSPKQLDHVRSTEFCEWFKVMFQMQDEFFYYG